MKVTGHDPRSGHQLTVAFRYGNFCGKRLETRIVRCGSPACRGALVDVEQVPIRAGHRPQMRRQLVKAR